MLLQQLQPHFLFNTLSTLKSLIMNDSQVAVDYVLKLSEFLRYAQTSTETEKRTLKEELDFTNDYVSLQTTRYDDGFICTINIPAEILYRKVPVFSIQTLVENALKHNRIRSSNPISIEIFYDNTYIVVKNTKLVKPLIQKSGTGLKNLNNRYKLLSEKEIIVEDTHDFFIVKIPLI